MLQLHLQMRQIALVEEIPSIIEAHLVGELHEGALFLGFHYVSNSLLLVYKRKGECTWLFWLVCFAIKACKELVYEL